MDAKTIARKLHAAGETTLARSLITAAQDIDTKVEKIIEKHGGRWDAKEGDYLFDDPGGEDAAEDAVDDLKRKLGVHSQTEYMRGWGFARLYILS